MTRGRDTIWKPFPFRELSIERRMDSRMNKRRGSSMERSDGDWDVKLVGDLMSGPDTFFIVLIISGGFSLAVDKIIN